MLKKTKKKSVRVNRKFLMDLASSIYDTKTRKFLRLCDGVLQNGPDPTNKKRPMHCGLGELYFAMTHRQPDADDIDEDDVIDLAVRLSPLNDARSQAVSLATNNIKKLKLPDGLKGCLLDEASRWALGEHPDRADEEEEFREVLDDIPSENDDSCGNACSFDQYRKRACRVAAKLRQAAQLLPE